MDSTFAIALVVYGSCAGTEDLLVFGDPNNFAARCMWLKLSKTSSPRGPLLQKCLTANEPLSRGLIPVFAPTKVKVRQIPVVARTCSFVSGIKLCLAVL